MSRLPRIKTPARVPGGFAAITLSANTIRVCCPDAVTPSLIAHELVHADQHRRFGLLFFLWYGIGWVVRGFKYANNPMEREAQERWPEFLAQADEVIAAWRRETEKSDA